MPTTKTFTREQLVDELDLPYQAGHKNKYHEVIANNIVDQGRWSTTHEMIFRTPDMEEGTAWLVSYSEGSTEYQEELPWEYEKEVEATLVRQVERVVKVWEAV